MNEENAAQDEPQRPMGSLACLAAGFEIVARHPALIVIPLLLDLFLWLGPRLSVAPVWQSAERVMQQVIVSGSASPDVEEARILVTQTFDDLAARYNLFASFRLAPLLGLPSLMAARMPAATPLRAPPVLRVTTLLGALVLAAGLGMLGLGANALYLRGIGLRVLDETEAALVGPGTTISLWRHLVGFSLFLLLLVGGFLMLTTTLITFVGLVSAVIAGLLMTVVFSLMIFFCFHLIFAIPGMVQLRRKPMQAIYESFLLTRGDFLNATFLVLLILVISRGFNFVWSLPEPASWATLVGVAGHAFVSTALTAALFVFYQERLEHLRILEHVPSAAAEAAVPPLVGE